MSDSKRLHPIAAVSNFIKHFKELIIPFGVFLFFGGKGSGWDLYYTIGSVGVVVGILITGILSWLRFTYRIEDGELRIESGVFIRKKRYIPFERIQSVDLTEGILHRPFGLVKVKIETAGSSGQQDAEAVLTAVTKSEAKEIQDFLSSMKNRERVVINHVPAVSNASSEEVLYRITPGELLLLASTSGGAGVVISAFLAFLSQFDVLIPYKRIFNRFEEFISNGIIFLSIIVFLGFVIAWFIAVLGTMIKYAGFTVKKTGDDLVISRGLLEKRQMTIPVKRIQAVRFTESLVRQPLGYGTVFVESAGGSASNKESSRVMVLPIIQKAKISSILEPYLKDYQLNVSFIPAPKRALLRFLIRGWLVAIVPVVLMVSFLKPWGYLSIILLLLSSLWSYLKYSATGLCVGPQQLALRYRTTQKHTVFMRKNKIQSITLKQSPFQRKKQLATFESFVKSGSGGGGGFIYDIEAKDSEEIYHWYSKS